MNEIQNIVSDLDPSWIDVDTYFTPLRCLERAYGCLFVWLVRWFVDLFVCMF